VGRFGKCSLRAAGNPTMTCPLCGGGRQRIVVRTAQWRVMYCVTCFNAWTDPPPAQKPYEEEDFHGQFEFKRVADLPRQWRTALEDQVRLLQDFVPAGAGVLEIGCGEGFLLSLLSARGFDVTGIEPSTVASERGRGRGLKVHTGYFPLPGMEESYDAVILSQVVEHIEDPRAILREVRRRLRSRGVVLLVQANWRGLVPRVLKERWYAWVPDQHYWHFTPKGMTRILQEMGFEIVAVRYSSLEHGSDTLSRFATLIPAGGDQFHLLARVGEKKETG